MSKRPADIIISTPASKVRRRLNFDSPYVSRAAAPVLRVTEQKACAIQPLNRNPSMYRMSRTPDVPSRCEGPCKVQTFESGPDIQHIGKVMCVSDVTGGDGLTHRVGKRFWVKSLKMWGKIGKDEIIKPKNPPNSVMFFLDRDGRPVDKHRDLGEVFSMFDNKPSTAPVKNVHRDRDQVLRKWCKTVTGGQCASKEQALVKKLIRVNNYVVYNHQEAGKYENHSENALKWYMGRARASNPVYPTLKIRIYFYDSVTN
nr:coat protein [Cotton leaf curl Burewala virus]